MEMGKKRFDSSQWRLTGHPRLQSASTKKGTASLGLLIGCLLTISLTSCGVKKVQIRTEVPKTFPKKESNSPLKKTTKSPSASQETIYFDPNQSAAVRVAKYIEIFGPIAQKEMETFHIPASITLAQGLLESGFGIGRLAQKANNHFGIKCHSDWNGERIYHDDDRKGECFRVYKSPVTSYRDHSLFLSERSRYAFLFEIKPTHYKAWAKGLKKAGYATDPKYPQKLISLIERYQLDRFDKKVKLKKRAPKRSSNYIASQKQHRVKKGDTLYGIARQYEIPVSELIRLNNIKNNAIYPGQELVLPKLD